MGCSSSSGDKKTVQVATGRRRLSVGEVDNAAGGSDEAVQQEDRGLIKSLDQQNIVEMLENGVEMDGRKFSIGSNTDQNKTSFGDKTTKGYGDAVEPANAGMGYTCRKGLKPESPNQDSWIILKMGDMSIYGVFDGHGQKGHDVSQFVKENLPKLIVKDGRWMTEDGLHPLLKDNFKKMQSLVNTADRMKKLSAQMSGTTATVCVHDHKKNVVTLAHVADSQAVMAFKKGDKQVDGKPLTRDHKPDLKDERQRIEKSGGRVVFDGYANHRVYAKNARYPGLNMSRCLGDLLGHQDAGLSAEPEVNDYEILPEYVVLLLCSDGVWEFIAAPEAAQIVCKHEKNDYMKAAEKLAKEAWDRWIREEGGAVVDDITVVLVSMDREG